MNPQQPHDPDSLKQILARVRRLELKIQRLMNSNFTGEYRSAFKGAGLEFDEVRAYQYGDDIRSIDWNVSARMNQLYVKIFREERELSLYVLLDLSGSERFGDGQCSKWLTALELSALLGFCTLRNNDRFGLLAFSDRAELHFPPAKGRNHVLKILGSVFTHQNQSQKTSLNFALEQVRRSVKRRSLMFVISDFIDRDYEAALKAVCLRHDVVLARLFHPAESLQQFEGLMPVRGLEQPRLAWVRSQHTEASSPVEDRFQQIDQNLATLAQQYKAGYLNIDITRDWLPLIEKFFNSHKHARLTNVADTPAGR